MSRRTIWLSLAVIGVGACGGGATPQTSAGAACGANVDPPVPRNAKLPTRRLDVAAGTQLRVINSLSYPVDIFWATSEQLYPFPIDRLRTEALSVGRALPGNSGFEVPAGLPEGSFYKLRSEPIPVSGGRPYWSLSPNEWRMVQLRLVCG